MQNVIALLFAVAGIFSAVNVVTRKESMQGALFLVCTLFAVAVQYILLHAEFLAAMQIIVYAGAIMVLIVFVIQLTGIRRPTDRPFHKHPASILTLSGIFLVSMLYTAIRIFHFFKSTSAAESELASVSTQTFSQTLFTQYLYPFEVASVLLLVAIVGTVLIAQTRGIRDDA